jgi:SAM-dependent methyltransferase
MAETSFSFGRNWRIFVDRYLNEERIQESAKAIENFVGKDALQGKSFLDVGCGSGLSSLAAFRLGAARILSFDVDPESVECCMLVREAEGGPGNWEVNRGSVLDEEFMADLGTFDIVYSWGVLHHTGHMSRAIDNCTKVVTPGGLLYLAIYNKADGLVHGDGRIGSSGFWAKEKRFYSRLPLFVQNILDGAVISVMVLGYLLAFKNPFRKMRDHQRLRGMSWRVDVKDWLGGYPYEAATVEEVFKLVKGCGFTLDNLTCSNGLRNNHYLFKKDAVKASGCSARSPVI